MVHGPGPGGGSWTGSQCYVYTHKMLTFLVRKEIVENNNSLVVISLSKVGENEFLPYL